MAKCKTCGTEAASPRKKWVMAGKADKIGKVFYFLIGSIYLLFKVGAVGHLFLDWFTKNTPSMPQLHRLTGGYCCVFGGGFPELAHNATLPLALRSLVVLPLAPIRALLVLIFRRILNSLVILWV
jgi:hypothetical protein